MAMEPYIKKDSPLRGARKPGLTHGPGQKGIDQRQRNEVASARRALKKAARQEGKRQLEAGEEGD